MFDTLVESTRRKRDGMTGRYFALTTAAYGLALAALAIVTIVGFSPVLAEEYMLESMLTPPPVPSGPPPAAQAQKVVQKRAAAPTVFASPVKPATKVLPASDIRDQTPIFRGTWVPGGPDVFSGAGTGIIPGGRIGNDTDPPPAPKVAPPLPPVAEAKRHETSRVSEGVLQGRAIRKVKPQYSAIARQVRAAGAVQVLVTISEEGNVIEAAIIEGHPLLRSAAIEAARQWLFSPTKLSGIPVKVQGVLTFDFILQ